MSSVSRPPQPASVRHLLLDALDVSVSEFRCRAHAHTAEIEELQSAHSIVFVRRGVFVREHEGERVVADANQVLFFNAGEPYRYAHPVAGGDHCTILDVSAEVAGTLVAACCPPRRRRTDGPFQNERGLATTRVQLLHWELLRLLREGATRLSAEDGLAELLDVSVRAAYPVPSGSTRPSTASARHRSRDMAEEIRLLLSANVSDPPSLSQLAARFGISTFHVSRSFHRVAGVTLRRYVGQLRARLAADRLAHGTNDLTRLALELGYHDHSHFTNAFRSAWGMPPSAFRRRLHPR